MKENYKEIQENTKKFRQLGLVKDIAYIIVLVVVGVLVLTSCTSNTDLECSKQAFGVPYRGSGNTANKSAKSSSINSLHLRKTESIVMGDGKYPQAWDSEGNFNIEQTLYLEVQQEAITVTIHGNVKAKKIEYTGSKKHSATLYCYNANELRPLWFAGVNKFFVKKLETLSTQESTTSFSVPCSSQIGDIVDGFKITELED